MFAVFPDEPDGVTADDGTDQDACQGATLTLERTSKLDGGQVSSKSRSAGLKLLNPAPILRLEAHS
jgi:hypothetical protein